jgi:hypothetical protein
VLVDHHSRMSNKGTKSDFAHRRRRNPQVRFTQCNRMSNYNIMSKFEKYKLSFRVEICTSSIAWYLDSQTTSILIEINITQ